MYSVNLILFTTCIFNYSKATLIFPKSEYENVTLTSSGCSCWFDPLEEFLNGTACACCQNNGIQCGYPLHQWCQPKVSEGQIQKGCIGNSYRSRQAN